MDRLSLDPFYLSFSNSDSSNSVLVVESLLLCSQVRMLITLIRSTSNTCIHIQVLNFSYGLTANEPVKNFPANYINFMALQVHNTLYNA